MSPAAAPYPVRAFVGLGANLDDPLGRVTDALVALGEIDSSFLLRVSRLYRTPPMGPPDQPDYVNAVACLETTLAPHALLDALQAIEAAHGRERVGERWGPRTLDLDLLLYGDRFIDDARLQVPHPGIAERVFVLQPLADVAADLEVPGLGSVTALLAARSADPIEAIDLDA